MTQDDHIHRTHKRRWQCKITNYDMYLHSFFYHQVMASSALLLRFLDLAAVTTDMINNHNPTSENDYLRTRVKDFSISRGFDVSWRSHQWQGKKKMIFNQNWLLCFWLLSHKQILWLCFCLFLWFFFFSNQRNFMIVMLFGPRRSFHKKSSGDENFNLEKFQFQMIWKRFDWSPSNLVQW